MKIGEVAKQTGVPTRMIRYYESRGLLEPGRSENGYREYDDADVARIMRIRDHLAAGLPTRLVKVVFDMERHSWSQACSEEFVQMLTNELDALDERITCLTTSRRTMADFLVRVATAEVT